MSEHPVEGHDLASPKHLGLMVQQSGPVQALGKLDACPAVLEIGVPAAFEILLPVEADVHRLVVGVLHQGHLAAALRPVPLDGAAEGLGADMAAVLEGVGVLLHIAQRHLGGPEKGNEALGAGALIHHAGDGVAFVQLAHGPAGHDAHHAGGGAGADDGGGAVFSETAAIPGVHIPDALQPGVVGWKALHDVLTGGQILVAGLDPQRGLHDVDAELQRHDVDDQLTAFGGSGDLVHMGRVDLPGGALFHQSAHRLGSRKVIVRADDLFDIGLLVQPPADGGALGSAAAYHYLFHVVPFSFDDFYTRRFRERKKAGEAYLRIFLCLFASWL